jgi:ATP-binding cassette subfamily B (MDR/TAP) protein 1
MVVTLTSIRQIRELQLATSQPIGMLFLEIVTAIVGFGTAFFFSWKLTLVIIATVPIAGGLVWLTSRSIGPAIENQKSELSRASKYAHNAVASIESVKAFNGEDQEVWQYFLTSRAITSFYLLQARANAVQLGILKFFAVGMYVSSFWFGLYLTLHDGATVGHVLTTFVACACAMQAAEVILPQYLVLAKGCSAGETLKSIMVEMQNGRNSKVDKGDATPAACPGDVEINDVSYLTSHLETFSNLSRSPLRTLRIRGRMF